MAKIVLASDFHFGVHRNNELFLESQLKFFKECFIPYLIKHNIDTIMMLGDFFDHRNHINIKIKNAVFDLFENHLSPFKIYMLVGNHDSYHTTTIEINSLKFLKKFDNIILIEDIEKVTIDNRDILLVPWQVDKDKFLQRVANKNIHTDVCMGHLEIGGFPLNGNRICEDGISPDVFFNNYSLIFSGHFHKRSLQKRGNSTIQYIGNPYHLTRHDIGEERGFCIFDTDTLDYYFVNNEVSIKYIKISYPNKFEENDIKGNIVDVEIDYSEGYDEVKVSDYLTLIESYKPIIAPIPKYINTLSYNNDDLEIETQTITELLHEYISTLNIENKEVIYNKIKNLFDECKGDLK